MGNIVNTVKRSLGNCSYLSNETPRLAKCSGDNDTSATGKSASAINSRIDGHGTFYNKVGNDELHLAAGSTSKSECLCAHMGPSGGDGAMKERETQNGTIHADSRKNGDANNSNLGILICNQTADHISCKLDDVSTKSSGSLSDVVSDVFVSKVSPEKRCCAKHEAAGDLENTPAVDAQKIKRSRLHMVPSMSLFDHEVCDEIIDGACNLGCTSTPEASLHNAMVPNEDTPTCASLDMRGCESTSRASLKRRVNRKRSKHKASYQTTALVPLDAKYHEMVIQPPLTRSKAKALSITTPESLKLRSTRSGRLIVPRLDPGSQTIIYDMDGSICGITNLELPLLQGSGSGPYSEPLSKRRKRSRCSSPGHRRLLLF